MILLIPFAYAASLQTVQSEGTSDTNTLIYSGTTEQDRNIFLPPDEAFIVKVNCTGVTEEKCKGAVYYT